MKKFYSYSIIIVLSMLVSCQKYLEVKPTNVLSVSSYEDVKTLMGSHLKMYTTGANYLSGTNLFFKAGNDYLITYFYSDDFLPDKYLGNAYGRNNRGNFYQSLNWQHASIHEELWKTHFTNIGFYNMVLDELDKFKGPSETATNIVKSEAKFLRAWQLFRLMQFFSPYHENKYGLPFNDNPEKVGSYDKSRKPQADNYAFILNELNEILSYSTEPSPTYSIFFDKNIIHALLAQVYLYKGDSGAKEAGDYEKAISHAQKAMQGRLSLETISRFPNPTDNFGMYKDRSYSLISFLYYDGNRHLNTTANPLWGLYQYASDALYNLFPDTDKRKEMYFNTKKEILKFKSNYPYSYYQWDFFTAPEMQLIIAESYIRANKEPEAIKALNDFTKTRYTSYTRPQGETLLQSILAERRKEFCFDYCMRWTDLTRLQKGWSRKALDKKDSEEFYTLEDGDYRFCMPLPKVAELQDNKIEQNPGWGNF